MYLRTEIPITSPYGVRKIRICQGDIMDYRETVNLLTLSAFEGSYRPNPGTLIGALNDARYISTAALAADPKLDLRSFCGCWISKKLPETPANPNIRRIGCIETNPRYDTHLSETWLSRIQSYYRILDMLPLNNVSVRHIVMPLLGTGNQKIDPKMIVVPLITETLHYLKRSPYTEDITFIERNDAKATILEYALTHSYLLHQEMQTGAKKAAGRTPLAFLSYSSPDRDIADLMCRKLEQAGIRVWYAPRDIASGNYASAIVNAISACSHFIAIISRSSLSSEHVLNEVDLAFEQLKRGIVLLPFRIDDQDLRAEFNYYLKRQQWMDAQRPPMEARIEEFIARVFT